MTSNEIMVVLEESSDFPLVVTNGFLEDEDLAIVNQDQTPIYPNILYRTSVDELVEKIQGERAESTLRELAQFLRLEHDPGQLPAIVETVQQICRLPNFSLGSLARGELDISGITIAEGLFAPATIATLKTLASLNLSTQDGDRTLLVHEVKREGLANLQIVQNS